MGTSYSTDEFSKCGNYLSIAKFNKDGNHWDDLSPIYGDGVSDQHMADLTNIMIVKKNYRGVNNDGIPLYWENQPEHAKLLWTTWDSDAAEYTCSVSIFDGVNYMEKSYSTGKCNHRLAIHNEAFLDYLKNGQEGAVFKTVSAELALTRTPIIDRYGTKGTIG